MDPVDFPEVHRFAIPDGAHWRDVRESPSNVGAALSHAMRRDVVRFHLRLALKIGDHLGRCPDDIRFEDPVTGDDIRATTVGLFVSNVDTAEEYAVWMAERDHGIWPVATEDDRAALADAYLEVALGYPPTEYSAELDLDEGGGVLLSELLESGARDLDRISDELEGVRDELAGRDASEPGQ